MSETVVERMQALADRLESDRRRWQAEDGQFLVDLHGAMSDFRRAEAGLDRLQLTDDTLLTLEQAACLPEFGGDLRRNLAFSTPSETVRVKTLRAAVAKGTLAITSPNSNHFVTYRQVKEAISTWQDRKVESSSSSAKPAVEKTAASRIAQRGSSTTQTSQTPSARDAVRMIVQGLKKR